MAKALPREPIPLFPANGQVSQKPNRPVGRTVQLILLAQVAGGVRGMHKQPSWKGTTILGVGRSQ